MRCNRPMPYALPDLAGAMHDPHSRPFSSATCITATHSRLSACALRSVMDAAGPSANGSDSATPQTSGRSEPESTTRQAETTSPSSSITTQSPGGGRFVFEQEGACARAFVCAWDWVLRWQWLGGGRQGGRVGLGGVVWEERTAHDITLGLCSASGVGRPLALYRKSHLISSVPLAKLSVAL